MIYPLVAVDIDITIARNYGQPMVKRVLNDGLLRGMKSPTFTPSYPSPGAPLFGGWGRGKTKAKLELFFRTCEEGALSIKLIVEDYPFAGEGARNR